MKAAAVAFAISPVVVSAIASGGPPAGALVNCAKPSASYCLGGDGILRCGADSIGIQGRCSDNVAGYPPFGGMASCQESSELAGDAACVKNCVVYAAQPYTLPAHKCIPSYTATGSHTGTPTGPATIPEETNTRTASNSATNTKPMATDTGIMSIPEGTSFEMPSATTHANHTTWTFINPSRNSSMTTSHSKSDKRPIETDTDTDTASSQPTTTATFASTKTGTGTGTGTSTPTSTAAANVNQAAGALAAAGFVAALFL
ncbi:hypothetical protein E4U59_002421 [Claviceps monticola]|nr:hypothetical protein E4U59_002421 [Claviceps monticola]